MEHIVQTIGKSSDLAEYIENGYGDDDLEDIAEEGKEASGAGKEKRNSSRGSQRSRTEGENLSHDMESKSFRNINSRLSKRSSQASLVDVADRHLRDKTDAIAHIIRNISEQCTAAVEGLQLAHDADAEAEEMARKNQRLSTLSSITGTTDDDRDMSANGSEMGEDSLLRPNRASSIPPTPDLVHRSSTAMSIASSTATTHVPDRSSLGYSSMDVPTKIVEHDEEHEDGIDDIDGSTINGFTTPTKQNGSPKDSLLHNQRGARISAIGAH